MTPTLLTKNLADQTYSGDNPSLKQIFDYAFDTYQPNDNFSKKGYKKLRLIIKRKKTVDRMAYVAALINAANYKAKHGKFIEAIDNYRKALGIDPKIILAKYNLLLVYIFNNQFENASILAANLEKTSSPNPLYFSGLGFYYTMVAKKYPTAITYYSKAIELGLRDPLPFEGLTFIHSEVTKKYDEGLLIYEKAKKTGIYITFILRNNYAYTLLKINTPATITLGKKQLDLIKVDKLSLQEKSIYYTTLGLYFFVTNNFENAVKEYETALDNPDTNFKESVRQNYYFELGNYYYSQNAHEKAESWWLKALQIKINPIFFNFRESIIENFSKLKGLPYNMDGVVRFYQSVRNRYGIAAFASFITLLIFIIPLSNWLFSGKHLIISPFLSLNFTLMSIVWIITSLVGFFEYKNKVIILDL